MAPDLSAPQAREAVRALRDGVPPDPSVSRWLTCGLRGPLQAGKLSLLRVTNGSYEVSLVAGSNGAGKSHLLSLFEGLAAEQGFLVSSISQDIATGVSLNRPGLLYRAIVHNFRPLVPDEDALTSLVRGWAVRALPVVENSKMAMSQFYRLRDAGLLPEYSPPRTTLCLLLYLWASRRNAEAASDMALSALRGDVVENRALCEAARSVGLEPGRIGWSPNMYASTFWFGQLRTVLAMARSVGRPGALIILDEIESLLELKLPSSKRRAYLEMSSLLRNAYEWSNAWLLLAYTPAFLVDLQAGAEEVREPATLASSTAKLPEGLKRRLEKITDEMAQEAERRQSEEKEFRRALSDLRASNELDLPTRLGSTDAECVIKRVREVYAIARGTSLRLADAKQTAQRWNRGGEPTRELIRMAVSECDEASSTGRVAPGLESASEVALQKLATRFSKR